MGDPQARFLSLVLQIFVCAFKLKARLHIRFPHAFSALRCNFLLLTLIEQNQGKLLKITTQCGKRMQKPDV
jgi:hypothetical protein